MKISEVIEKLQEIQKEHGDLEVWHNYSYSVQADRFRVDTYSQCLYINPR